MKRVLVVFKCHLDVGFTQTQAQVMRKYFDVYYPAAMRTAAALRGAGSERYIWTTGSWLLYEYLEQAAPAQRRAMEHAIEAGDITWHALPFSWQTEMLDRSMIEGALGLSGALNARFGRKTIGAKMTDVPRHSRGIIAPLQAVGVRLLDIGVNSASTPPDVPDVFVWKDSAANSIVMIYHRHDYGSVLQIPGAETAISIEVRNDNSGPHTHGEIAAIYARLRTQFPEAKVEAGTLNDVALAVEPYRSKLPLVTEEIGDTWIYGIPSDPAKVRWLATVKWLAFAAAGSMTGASPSGTRRIDSSCGGCCSPSSTRGERIPRAIWITRTIARWISPPLLTSQATRLCRRAGRRSATISRPGSRRCRTFCATRLAPVWQH